VAPPSVKDLVLIASSVPIDNALLEIKRKNLRYKRWLGVHNKYTNDVVKQVDINSKLPFFTDYDLTEYLTTSIFLHNLDGWNFLSQSINALLNNCDSIAIHMAYYAELRAGISFLAAQGIGVFNYNHLYIDSSNMCNIHKDKGTHTVTWDALTEWAKIPHRSSEFLKLFKVNTIGLDQWIIAANYNIGSSVSTDLASDWLSTWSLDLAQLSKDHLLRNEASYRPNFNTKKELLQLSNSIKDIIHFWDACEPSNNAAAFGSLDQHLLREAMEFTYHKKSNRPPKGKAYIVYIDTAFSYLSISNPSLRNFLLRLDNESKSTHPILKLAKQKTNKSSNIIARAILLLRVSTASINNLVISNGITKEKISFWWEKIGSDVGLWETDHTPENLFDLWADIEAIIDDLEPLIDSPINLLNLLQTHSLDLWQLTQFQRAGLWGMGL